MKCTQKCEKNCNFRIVFSVLILSKELFIKTVSCYVNNVNVKITTNKNKRSKTAE